MKMKWMLACGLACAVLIVGCGKGGNQAPAADESAGAQASTTTEPTAPATEAAPAVTPGQSSVSSTDAGFIITGSGSGRVGPITFDQPYYIVKAKYDTDDQFSLLQVSYKRKMGDTEMDDFLANVGQGGEYSRVFQPVKGDTSSVDITFDIASEGKYTVEFRKPLAQDGAQPAPLTVTGGQGTTITPLVKTKGNYVMLRLKYTGAVDPGKVGGMPLATGDLFDAVTGDPWVRNQSVYDHNIQSQGGASRDAPGGYFAIIQCGKDGGAWEATITESSSD